MTIIDLSHTILPTMPVYPGTEPPVIRQANTIEQDGFAEKQISFYSHTGTHIDAPAHMLPGAATLDQLDVSQFVGNGWVVDVSTSGPEIGRALLEAQVSHLEACEFVLFHTGWCHAWGQKSYFSGFPVLSQEAAHWLGHFGLKGAGFDAISADPVGADFTNHFELFRAGMIIIENLNGLEALLGKPFLFSCLPLKLDRGDGSPVRAIAMVS